MWEKTIGTLNGAVKAVTVFFFIVMVVLVFFQIVSRAILGTSYAWTGEIARFAMVWITFLGASFSFQYGAHISIDIFVKKFPIKIAKIITVMTSLIIFGFLVVLFYEGINLVKLGLTQKASALKIQMAYIFSIIPISSVCMMLNLIDVTKKMLTSEEEGVF